MSLLQADRVETLIKARGARRNGPWNGRAAVAAPAGEPITLGSAMRITLLSPTMREVQPLARKWEEFRTQQRGGRFEDERDDTEGVADQDADVPAASGDEPALYLASVEDDARWRSRLMTALEPTVPPGQVFRGDVITVGEWRRQSRTAIEQARVAVVLVSRAALESPFLMQEELPELIKAAESGSLVLTWLLLERCDWPLTNLQRYEALRSPEDPMDTMPGAEVERALAGIAARLTQLVGERSLAPSAQTARRQRGAGDGPIDVEALLNRPYTPDRSVANNSSLAFLAELHDKAILICGDASAEVLTASIQTLNRQRRQERLRVDAFVVPHNGSARNLTRELLLLVDCDRYLISTDGSTFRHPDRETIARILGAGRGPQSRPLTLVFNYRTQWTAVWDDPELKKRWNYETVYPTGEGGIKVRI